MFNRIEAELTDYEASRRYQPANVIHGDPVFSNVLVCAATTTPRNRHTLPHAIDIHHPTQ